MKSTPKRSNRQRQSSNRFRTWIWIIVVIGFLVGGGIFMKEFILGDTEEEAAEQNEPDVEQSNANNESDSESDAKEITDIRIAAVGDIMVHDAQLDSAYDAESDTYDFTSMFEDVKPIFNEADMSIANFETTTAGSAREYTGFPMFNSPDEIIDAIDYAGIDTMTTANNHSLDTGSEGLKRTVKIFREQEIDTVGTYDEAPDSRVLMKEVEGVKLAILSYTESTNGLGDEYPADELNGMINLMTKENIRRDVEEAKSLEADFIITFMHWGIEYMEEPNDTQVDFAHMMAEEGVDLILGSHPHVIQKSDIIEANGKETYVVYSMGNFISNQRQETLGNDRELTEDGIIINFDLQKNEQTDETTLENIKYVPTWVYRNQEEGESKYTYRILPIENFLVSEEISEAYKSRMERSLDDTISKMYETPTGKN